MLSIRHISGGLKRIDLNSFNKALKLSWVRKYLDNNNSGKWKLLFDFQLQHYGGSEFFRCNLNRKDLSKYINVQTFLLLKLCKYGQKLVLMTGPYKRILKWEGTVSINSQISVQCRSISEKCPNFDNL